MKSNQSLYFALCLAGAFVLALVFQKEIFSAFPIGSDDMKEKKIVEEIKEAAPREVTESDIQSWPAPARQLNKVIQEAEESLANGDFSNADLGSKLDNIDLVLTEKNIQVIKPNGNKNEFESETGLLEERINAIETHLKSTRAQGEN